jgi:peptidoglycan/xylan/chitin deacetylase (PgdA/CDA1 family)
MGDLAALLRGMLLRSCGNPLVRAIAPDSIAGRGAIFCLHSVRPMPAPDEFAPLKEVFLAPDSLDKFIGALRADGMPIVPLADVPQLLSDPGSGYFVCFTFDDGYADNASAAWPIFRRWNAPFTIFLTSGFMDGPLPMWWTVVETAIAATDRFTLGDRSWRTRTKDEKTSAFLAVEGMVRFLDRAGMQQVADELAMRYGDCLLDAARAQALSWDNVAEMAQDPLVDFGAHTLSHPTLSKLSHEEAVREIVGSRQQIEQRLSRPVPHFAYPYGDDFAIGPHGATIAAEAGFDLAVTTRRDVLTADDRFSPYRLPRITLDGRYQAHAQLRGQMSGIPSSLRNALSRKRQAGGLAARAATL